jgi:hypothetical protein
MKEDYVNFGDMARSRIGGQSQYLSRYIDGAIPSWPNLGEGLRFEGKPSDYWAVRIHKDDVEEFIRRVEQYQEDSMQISRAEVIKKYNIRIED